VSDVNAQQAAAQVAADLRESEEKYRAFFENSLDAILLTSPDGSIQTANPAACAMFGRTEAEICALGRGGLVDATDPRLAALLAERARTGRAYGELTMFRADGAPFPVEISSALFQDSHGRARASIIIRDITARKQAEAVIRQKSQDLAALLEISRTLATTVDTQAVLQIIVERATNLARLNSGAIYLLQEDNLYLGATTPPLPWDFPEAFRRAPLADHPHIRESVSTGRPIVLPDAAAADLSPAEQAIVATRGLRSVLYLPLLIEKRAVGVLIVGTTGETRAFSESEIDLYRALAGQAALASENARLFEEIQRNATELEQRVTDRTAEMRRIVNLMAGREVRMAELKGVIHQLRDQLARAGLRPVADDPLLGEGGPQ
jgi:PAS domain S-box-containing protein